MRRFLRALTLSILAGGSVGMLASLIWMTLFYFDRIYGVSNLAMIMLSPLIVPYGIVITLPVTILPSVIIGLILSALSHTGVIRSTEAGVIVGASLGGLTGYGILESSISYWGSAIPGLIIGAAIGGAWSLFDKQPGNRTLSDA